MNADVLASEFLAWFWHLGIHGAGKVNLPDGREVEFWPGDRILLKNASCSFTMKGDNVGVAKATRTAACSGRAPSEMECCFRDDDKEFSCTITDQYRVKGIKLPKAIGKGDDGFIESAYLYERFYAILEAVFSKFVSVRTSALWDEDAVPGIREFLAGDV